MRLSEIWWKAKSPIRRIERFVEDHYEPTFSMQEATVRTVWFLEDLRKNIDAIHYGTKLGVCRLVRHSSPDTIIVDLGECEEYARAAKAYESLQNMKQTDLPEIRVTFFPGEPKTHRGEATELWITPFSLKKMWLNANQKDGEKSSHRYLNYQVDFRPEPADFIKLQEAIFTAIMKNPNLTAAQCRALKEMWEGFDKKKLPLFAELPRLSRPEPLQWRDPTSP